MMSKDIKALEPEKRVEAMIKLASFVIPKPQSVDMTITGEKKKTIEDALEELSGENDN